MSTQRKAEFAENELSEDAICDYLVAHPDFFENHKTVLSGMQLPHASGGTVSLVERHSPPMRLGYSFTMGTPLLGLHLSGQAEKRGRWQARDRIKRSAGR
ncbi:MAG: DUF484 family protein [Nitrospinae bacterium]|nr:DUF484 family protein [Nitrospinota bacterium]